MSQYDWILDVLGDLKSFAESNNLTLLAEQLDDTSLLAAAEIASKAPNACQGVDDDDDQSGSDPRKIGQHQSA